MCVIWAEFVFGKICACFLCRTIYSTYESPCFPTLLNNILHIWVSLLPYPSEASIPCNSPRPVNSQMQYLKILYVDFKNSWRFGFSMSYIVYPSFLGDNFECFWNGSIFQIQTPQKRQKSTFFTKRKPYVFYVLSFRQSFWGGRAEMEDGQGQQRGYKPITLSYRPFLPP